MSANNSHVDNYKVIAALLRDAQHIHHDVFSIRNLENTLNKVSSRLRSEGVSFLTKTLPALGKAFDKALSEEQKLNATALRWKPQPGSKLPIFLGELFNQVLDKEGNCLPNPCIKCVGTIRQVLFVFYKYELEFSSSEEQRVIDQFLKTEDDILTSDSHLEIIQRELETAISTQKRRCLNSPDPVNVAREARILLNRVFSSFDPRNISPRHGPGAVATKQQLWSKFEWVNVSRKITDYYPFDAYFMASGGHVCDNLSDLNRIGEATLPARVLLVPKDSRGPRLISCEPVDFQWIQQGLGRAIVKHVEEHAETKFNVFFTDQGPNQRGALLGSFNGRYATLDLKEASDRVSLRLVQLLFPPHLFDAMDACRSEETVLPDGKKIKLKKFAPMGSCLCFPTMALTIWALLTAGAPNADTRESILVYGDDVIVPTDYSACAMSILESFGLKINRDKSCTKGSFRESCGTDAYKGICVTPSRLRTVWKASPSPDVYTSWIAYANSFWDRRYYHTYDEIVGRLHRIYGAIPSDDMNLSCPSLRDVSREYRPKRRRTNTKLQKLEYFVRDVQPVTVLHEMNGWNMLLRYFSMKSSCPFDSSVTKQTSTSYEGLECFSVRSYTRRGTNKFVRRWR